MAGFSQPRLAITWELDYNNIGGNKKHIKAGRGEPLTPHAPMQDDAPSHTTVFYCTKPIIIFPGKIIKEIWAVCSVMRCRDILPCAAFVVSMGTPAGDGNRSTTPKGKYR